MVSLFRLKGRGLQISKSSFLTLIFFLSAAIVFLVGFSPFLFSRGIKVYSSFFSDYVLKLLNLLLSIVAILLEFLSFSLINLGIKRYFLKRAERCRCSLKDIFLYFRPKKFLSATVFSMKLAAVRVSIFLFCFFPSVIGLLLLFKSSLTGTSLKAMLGLVLIFILFFLSGAAFCFAFSQSFFLCEYFYITGKYVSFRHIVASSQSLMKNNKALLTRIKLSFSGWFVLCLTLIPISYVWSYYNQTLAVAAGEFMRTKEG